MPSAAALLTATLSALAAAGAPPLLSFSGGVSQGTSRPDEQVLLNYTLSASGEWGVVNSWWMGGGQDAVTLSFYVDGGMPIVMDVPAACGAGFGAPTGPVTVFSSAYFGKGAATSGWVNKLPVPFGRSIVVTYRSATTQEAWLWVRGVENLPILPGVLGTPLPPTARLSLQIVRGYYQPQTFLDVVSLPTGARGLVLAWMLSLVSGNLNVLEGCVYLAPTAAANWSNGGVQLLATGTEDVFESSYYFDGGRFAGPYAGATFLDTAGPGGAHRVSAYKVWGAADPLAFSDGVRVTWRVGDQNGPGGLKCSCPPGAAGCVPNGDPQPTNVTSYAWVYAY